MHPVLLLPRCTTVPPQTCTATRCRGVSTPTSSSRPPRWVRCGDGRAAPCRAALRRAALCCTALHCTVHAAPRLSGCECGVACAATPPLRSPPRHPSRLIYPPACPPPGLGSEWERVKTAYAAANRALGDIVKVGWGAGAGLLLGSAVGVCWCVVCRECRPCSTIPLASSAAAAAAAPRAPLAVARLASERRRRAAG